MTPEQVAQLARDIVAEADAGTLWTHGAVFDEAERRGALKECNVAQLCGYLDDEAIDVRGLSAYLKRRIKARDNDSTLKEA